MKISNHFFTKHRHEYEGKFTYCPECNRDYCPGFDGIDTYCDKCLVFRHCPSEEDREGAFREACLKRLPEFNDTLIVKQCNICFRKKVVNGLIGDIENKERKNLDYTVLKWRLLALMCTEKDESIKEELSIFLNHLEKPKVLRLFNKKLLKRHREEKRKLRLEKRGLKKERQKKLLFEKVISLEKAKARLNEKKVAKKQKMRIEKLPKLGFRIWKLSTRSVCFR